MEFSLTTEEAAVIGCDYMLQQISIRRSEILRMIPDATKRVLNIKDEEDDDDEAIASHSIPVKKRRGRPPKSEQQKQKDAADSRKYTNTTRKRIGAAQRNSWEGLTPEERRARTESARRGLLQYWKRRREEGRESLRHTAGA